MPSKAALTTLLLVAFNCLSHVTACPPLAPRQDPATSDGQVTYPWAAPGDDAPADPKTTGYFINHLCLNVRNASASIDFYTRAFGLRLMFTQHVSEHFSISYMGHAHGGRNGTGYQSADEMNRQKNNIEGLLELLHLDVPEWALPAGVKTPNTFHHIGMVVPNVTDTQARLEEMGATIYKAAGAEFTLDGPFVEAAGLAAAGDFVSQEERDLILASLGPLNKPLIFAADPDGNIIEIQNQEGSEVV